MSGQRKSFAAFCPDRIGFAALRVAVACAVSSTLIPAVGHAAQVTFRWDYSASGAAGFVLYCGPSSGSYNTRVDVGNTETYTIGILPPGAVSFCVVTAYAPGQGESVYSNEVSVSVPPAAPTVDFSASPVSGTAPLSVVFTNKTTGQVTSWRWDFGDGSTTIVSSPTHVYSFPGSYTATLTATGPGGTASKTAPSAVTVAGDGAPPPGGIVVPLSGGMVKGKTTFRAIAPDNGRTVAVQSFPHGGPLGTEQASGGSSPSSPATPVPNEIHSLAARTPHAAGEMAVAPAMSVTNSNSRPSGLVAAYGFEEGRGASVADLSGNGNTGTLSRGVTWTTHGRFGSALKFDGSSGRVDILDVPSLRLTTAMTLEAWVNPATVSNNWSNLIYKGNDNYALAATSDQAGPPAGRRGVNKASGTALLPTNIWTHLAVTYDKTMVRLYVNGMQVSSRASTADIPTSAFPLQIGGDSLHGQYFQGLIDEVRVYNRALSQAEIQADMNTPLSR